MTTQSKPLISIITVVLNGAATIEKAIKSVFQQRFKDFEYIIIDGGSTDGTLGIITKYDSKLTHWISEPDEGVYDAMNKALTMANGRWIYFLGADDQLLDGLGTAASYLKDENTIYYGDVYRPVINRIYDGQFSAYKLGCRNICQQSIFYPRHVWDRHPYNLTYPILADYDLNLRCFADPGIQFQYVPVTIAIFSDEGGLSPTREDSTFQNDKPRLIKDRFPFWVYVLISIRSFFIGILAQLGLQKISLKIYHSFLRVVAKSPKRQTGNFK